jgi:O-antigen ligase
MAAADQPRLTARPPGMGPRARAALAAALLVLLFGAVLTLWVPDRRPLGCFQAGVYTVAVLAILRVLWRRSRLRGSRLLIPLAAVLVLGGGQIAANLTTFPPATVDALLAWTTDAALVFLAAQLFADTGMRRQALRLFFYFGFGVSVLALAQMGTSHGKVFWLFPTGYSDFVMGPFVSRNLYSAFIELLLPIGLFYIVSGRRPWLHGAMCCVMLASVVAGASRAGVLLASAEVVATLVLARSQGLLTRRALLAQLTLAAAGCAAIVALSGGTAVWQRLHEADPYGVRRELLQSSVDMVRERPWSGFGMGTWQLHYPRFAYYDDGTVTRHAHNDWAEWAAEGGVPLVALMLSLAVLTARPAARSLWGIGVLAVWVHCLVDSPLQNPVVAGWVLLLAGMAVARAGTASGEERSFASEAVVATQPGR